MNNRGLLLLLLRLAAGLGACASLPACTAPAPKRVVTNPDPSVKIPAIKHAVEVGDVHAVAQMVEDLENDDPAVRLFAIEGLRRLTGESFGYDYYAPEDQRRHAVLRWQKWLDEQKEQHGK